MTQIQVDQILLKQLGGLASPLEFCDDSGHVLGYFVPETEYRKMLYSSFEIPLTPEEIADRRSESGGSTLEEIWQELGQK